MNYKTTKAQQYFFILLVFFNTLMVTAQTNLPYFTNFESNRGGWTDGGNRSRYYEGWDYAPQGSNAWEIRDNEGNDSSFYQDFNLSGYTTVTISFSFMSRSFDNDDDAFRVRLDDTTVLSYTHDDDWDRNNRKYTVTITLNSNDYTFTNNSEIKFESRATRSNDYVYFDEISITGESLVAPVSEFTADNTTPYTDDVVTFTDTSTNTPASWAWSFSNSSNVNYVNGTTASSQNPQVTFSTAGFYSVTLIATNSGGNDDEIKTNYINVVEPASDNPASFTVSQSTTAPYTFFDYSAIANASSDPILVAYNTTNSFGTPATDGNGNATINGNGTILFEGAVADINTTINSNPINQLRQNTTYYFKAWSVGSAGFSRGLEANATTAAVEIPNSFSATASTSNNSAAFTANANSLDDNLMLVFNTEDDFGIPEDGTLYQIDDEIGNATVLLSSVTAETISNYIDDFLLFDTDYYYRIYSVSNGIWYYSQAFKDDDIRTIEVGDIWQNEIESDDTQDDMPYTRGQEVNTNISVSGVSLGNGLRIRNDDDKITVDRISEGNNLDITDNDYFEFTLTPNTGYEINFNKFFYDSDSDGDVEQVVLRSSIDAFSSNLGNIVDGDGGANIDLTDVNFQGIDSAITFRLYMWEADENGSDFELEDFGFKGTVTQYAIWDGTSWSNTDGPNLGMRAVINGDYNTGVGGIQTSFRCKSLKVNPGNTLTVGDSTFVEVNYDALIIGDIIVETRGNFVQRDNDAKFEVNGNGTSKVNKSTPFKDQWYHYTYWSSPVADMDVNVAFPNINKRFYWDGVGARWMYMGGGAMVPTRGYTITGKTSGVQNISFTGEFNTGTITASIPYNSDIGENWNLIGNPYPSAIDLNQFLGTNTSVLEGAAYFWSQETAPVGGEFSGTDYIPFNATGSVSTSPDPNKAVNGFVPSGQSFFIAGKAAGNAIFNNAMRMADTTSNSQFFKGLGVPPKGLTKNNKLWLNLVSDNGVFSQILVGYVDGATNEDDGLLYDAIKFGEGSGSYLYSIIKNSDKEFVVQGKDSNAINNDEEVVALGYRSSSVNTFSISLAKVEGSFFDNNTSVYVKDKELGVVHDLSSSSYEFFSEQGAFNERFEIAFTSQALSTTNFDIEETTFNIIELDNNMVQLSINNSLIKEVNIYNTLGQRLFTITPNGALKEYNFKIEKNAVYFAKAILDNNRVITKKFIKR